MLGKRTRASHQMRRTTSMTGISITTTVDPSREGNVGESPPVDLLHQYPLTGNGAGGHHLHVVEGPTAPVMVGPNVNNNNNRPNSSVVLDHYQRLTLSARYSRTMDQHHYGGLETGNFLRNCGLCNRRLAPGRDIFLYRGDRAFCSQECREQRMKQDERKEKHDNKMAVVKAKKYSDQQINYQYFHSGH